MPIRDRKSYIKKHNGEQIKLNEKRKKTSNSPILLNQVARMKQDEINNLNNDKHNF